MIYLGGYTAQGGQEIGAAALGEGVLALESTGEGGKLRRLGMRRSGGAQPIHVSVHPSGRYLLVAN